MAGKLEGKVALVTGGSSGIGEATALALVAEGAVVAAAARRADRLDALARKVTDQGGRLLALDLDVTDEAQCRAAVERTRSEFGGLDIVVNNAGVMLLGPILDADTDDWRRMINTNVLGLMYVTHAALPSMVAQGSGDIVNVSSVAGRVARRGAGVYNASKWAVNAFTESLRQEVTGRGVRVSAVEPGYVATELTEHITHGPSREESQQFGRSIRQLRADDIAHAIVYIVTQPDHVAINEVLVRPTDQER